MVFNFRAIVRVLVAHDVEFAVAGGLAGVMQGAPIHTQDLDMLYSLFAPPRLDGPRRYSRAGVLFASANRREKKIDATQGPIGLRRLAASGPADLRLFLVRVRDGFTAPQ
jgi:hypothetical protein